MSQTVQKFCYNVDVGIKCTEILLRNAHCYKICSNSDTQCIRCNIMRSCYKIRHNNPCFCWGVFYHFSTLFLKLDWKSHNKLLFTQNKSLEWNEKLKKMANSNPQIPTISPRYIWGSEVLNTTLASCVGQAKIIHIGQQKLFRGSLLGRSLSNNSHSR